MHLRVVDEIFSYAQNLGSHEDIVTGALATAFCYCPKFTEKFFKKIGINFFKWKDGEEYRYLIDTGWEINGNYSWLKNNSKFRPDILISKNEKWDEKKPPKNEQLILIEAKIWARFGANQRKKYYEFRREYLKQVNEDIQTLLISIEEDNSDERYAFDSNLTWNKLIEISEDIYKSIPEWNSESVLLRELLDFTKIRLFPDNEDFKNENDIYCPKILLQKMKYRLSSNLGRVLAPYKIKENDMDCKPYHDLIKLYNLLDNDLMSAFIINGETKERYLCCAVKKNLAIFWVADYSADTKNGQDCRKIGTVKLDSQYWYDVWFDIMTKVYRLVNG
jgi:hypothetical protein